MASLWMPLVAGIGSPVHVRMDVRDDDSRAYILQPIRRSNSKPVTVKNWYSKSPRLDSKLRHTFVAHTALILPIFSATNLLSIGVFVEDDVGQILATARRSSYHLRSRLLAKR